MLLLANNHEKYCYFCFFSSQPNNFTVADSFRFYLFNIWHDSFLFCGIQMKFYCRFNGKNYSQFRFLPLYNLKSWFVHPQNPFGFCKFRSVQFGSDVNDSFHSLNRRNVKEQNSKNKTWNILWTDDTCISMYPLQRRKLQIQHIFSTYVENKSSHEFYQRALLNITAPYAQNEDNFKSRKFDEEEP